MDSSKVAATMASAHAKSLVAISFMVAFCSMLYELLLAQTLTATLGDTVSRYTLTIGLYLASMGVGAARADRLRPTAHLTTLVDAELLLSMVGALCPLYLVLLDGGGRLAAEHGLPGTPGLVWVLSHAAIVLVGLLTGLELPLLMSLAEAQHPGHGTRILILDYVGTLAAALLFPAVLLPAWGIVPTALLAATLSAGVSVALLLLRRHEDVPRSRWIVALGLTALLLGLLPLASARYEQVLRSLYVAHG